MVVITIIGILVTLIAVASIGFVGRARQASTRTTITKIDEAIQERVASINRWHEWPYDRLRKDWNNRGWIQRWAAPPYNIPRAVLRGDNTRRQDILLKLSRKEAMKETFPITQSELKQCYWFWGQFETNGTRESTLQPPNNIPLSTAEQAAMQTFLADIDSDSSNGAQSLDQPGEIFLYALKNAPVFGGLPMVADDFEQGELTNPSENNDPDGDGVPELIDAWERPLRFYRWPTRLVNNGEPFNSNPQGTPLTTIASANWTDNAALQTLIPNAPSDLKADPDDPTGTLANYNLMTARFHDIYTWHAPLIVSAGGDGEFGLEEPDVSLPVDIGGTTFHRYGLARPLVTSLPSPAPVKPHDGSWTPTTPAPEQLEFLYDNITNHTSDGGL